jgi:ATPase involved in DNA replication initiation
MQEWERFLDAQEKRLGKETTDKWLRSLKVVHFDACNLYLEAKDSFQLTWFEEQMRDIVSKAFVNNNHRKIKVHLTVSSVSPLKTKEKKKQLLISPREAVKFSSELLDPYATLPNFVPCKGNCVLEKFIAEQTKTATLSPVYIHGIAASGKTHLLMAIAHLYKARGLSPFYVRAETFTDQLVHAIRQGAMQDFRKAYRHADILLIDDVHEIARRSATQEELFHTFNALHTSGKPIYLTSRLPPKALLEIEARLVSRFEWGITLQLEHLPKEGMQTVLLNRAKSLSFSLSSDVLEFLLETFHRNTAVLLHALHTFVLRSHLNKTSPPSVLLADLIEKEKKSETTAPKIMETVAAFYGLSPEDLVGKSQSRDVALPRQVALYLCRIELKLPYLKIGALFGRDHSTVMTSVKQIEKKIKEEEKELISALAEIRQKLN